MPAMLAITLHFPRRIPRARRRGISLLEVLISMFVLLFGLMGLLAMIPIANFHLLKAAQYDRAASVAEVAFGEIRSRRLLRPDNWRFGAGGQPLISSNILLIPAENRLPGTFCVDPLFMAPVNAFYNVNNVPNASLSYFPARSASTSEDAALFNATVAPNALIRVGWPGSNNNRMERSLADRIFVWNGDLSLDLPDDHDLPGRMITRRDATPTRNPLVRQSKGDYSWMFTATPVGQGPIWTPDIFNTQSGRWVGDAQYEISVVVFYKRVVDRRYARERMFPVLEFYGGLSGGEARLTASSPTAFEGVREGQWICLTAREASGHLVAKWYRIITAGEGFYDLDTLKPTLWVGLAGPDWNPKLELAPGTTVQAIFVEDVVGVFTQTMSITQD